MFGLMPWRREAAAGTLQPREDPFRLMRQEFDHLLDRFFGMMEPYVPAAGWDVEMEEGEKEVLFKVPLPGFAPDELEVTLRGETLVVRAEHKEPMEKGEGKGAEPRVTRVHRAISLPMGTDLDKLTATYRNGVLEVRLPRTPEAKGRRIEVKA